MHGWPPTGVRPSKRASILTLMPGARWMIRLTRCSDHPSDALCAARYVLHWREGRRGSMRRNRKRARGSKPDQTPLCRDRPSGTIRPIRKPPSSRLARPTSQGCMQAAADPRWKGAGCAAVGATCRIASGRRSVSGGLAFFQGQAYGAAALVLSRQALDHVDSARARSLHRWRRTRSRRATPNTESSALEGRLATKRVRFDRIPST